MVDRFHQSSKQEKESKTQTVCSIGGGAATPIGHWRSGSETDTPTMSFGVGLFEHRPLRRYFLLQLLIEY